MSLPLIFCCCLLTTNLSFPATAASGDSIRQFPGAPALAGLAHLPLAFENIQTAVGENPQFVARGQSGSFFLTPTEATITLMKGDSAVSTPPARAIELLQRRHPETRTICMQFIGANPHAHLAGEKLLAAKVNHFMGADPSCWRTDLPLFERVRVQKIYPGVDLIYYGNQQNLEYDFIVNPGADPHAISFRLRGADSVEISQGGDLVLTLGPDQLRHHKPVVHQVVNGFRHEILASYHLKDQQTVAFQLGHYDPEWPLIIDPVLSYATYLGGTGSDTAWSVALDGAGNVYVAGETLSPNLPTTRGAFQRTYAGGYPGAGGDAFIAKFDNAGSNLLYMTYLGGNGDDAALSIAVDASGVACLTGVTDSTNFPVKNALQPTIHGQGSYLFGLHPYDAFVTKLNSAGSALVYSTYLGGDTQDQGIAVAMDPQGNAYVTGLTDSTNFPTVLALQQSLAGDKDAFVTKISSNGLACFYSTYLGGTNEDTGSGIAVDSAGRAFITGVTLSTNFPVVNAFQPWLAGGKDAFVTCIDPTGTNLLFSTYLGGGLDDSGSRVALDSFGNPYITGTESSSLYYVDDFPTSPGTINPGGVFISTDAAALWLPANVGFPHPRVLSLAVDPVSPNRIYAGTPRGPARSSDAGATWDARINVSAISNVAPALAIGPVYALAVDPITNSRVYAGTVAGLYQSTDFGTNWTLSSTQLFGTVTALALNPVNSSIVYAGTPVGIYESLNSAATWTRVTAAVTNVASLIVHPASSATVYAASSGAGVYLSLDYGVVWKPVNSGLTNLFATKLVFDPQTPSTLYVGTSSGPFKTTNGGTNWIALSFGPGYTNLGVNALAVDPAAPLTLYAGTPAGVFKTADGGSSWIQATNGLADTSISALALTSGSPATLLAGTTRIGSLATSDAFLTKLNGNSGSVIFSSTFGGTAVNQGWAVAVDGSGNAYVAGVTSSIDFPTSQTAGFLRATNSGLNDAFVTAINADASATLYSVLLGGQANDFAYGIGVDPAGNAYVVGRTFSTDFPVHAAFQPSLGSLPDAFLAKIAVQPNLTAAVSGNMLQVKWPAFLPDYQLESAAGFTPPLAWSTVLQTPVLSNGWHTVTLPPTNAAEAFRLRLH